MVSWTDSIHFPWDILMEESFIFILAVHFEASMDRFDPRDVFWKRSSLFLLIAYGSLDRFNSLSRWRFRGRDHLCSCWWLWGFDGLSGSPRRFRGRDHLCSRWLLWGGLFQLLLEVLPLLVLFRPVLHDWVGFANMWNIILWRFNTLTIWGY